MVANDHGFNDVFQSTYNKHLAYLYLLRRKTEQALQCSSKEMPSAEL